MAKGWKCPRCSTNNSDAALRCVECGLMRGGVVVPGSHQPSGPAAWPGSIGPPSSAAEPALGSREQGAGETDFDRAAGFDEGPDLGAGLDADPAHVGWPPPVPDVSPATPLWRRLPWGWALTFVLVGGGAIGGLIFNAGRSDSGEINKPGDLTVADLRVGDCYDLKDPTADEVEQVVARPCSEEHQFELFFLGDHPGGTYPDDAAFLTFVEATCLPAFEAFVGATFDESVLDINWLSPTSAGWSLGDRTVQCAVFHPLNERLTSSLKGTNQ